MARVERGDVDEAILATSPTLEGEATASSRGPAHALPVRIKRIATGVPAGSDIEYADEVTMARARRPPRTLMSQIYENSPVPDALRNTSTKTLTTQPGQQVLRVDGLCENLKFVALRTGTVQQVCRCRLPGNNNILQLGSIPRILIAASTPFMSFIITLEISMSGFIARAVSTAFSPL